MTDAISRSAVLGILRDEFDMAAEERAEADNEKDRTFNAGEIHCARRSIRKVNELPAVDAVPVVRCRECCYLAKDGESPYCTYHDNINVAEEFFCAAGEVKDAQTNRPDGQHARQGTDGN